MPSLKKNTKVNIYHDPLTEKELEGLATLQVFRYSGGEYFGLKCEWWVVKFLDGTKALRKVKVKS